MKKLYNQPEIEIVELVQEEVITTSTPMTFGGGLLGDTETPW